MVKRALVATLYWRMAWEDSNPNVGMGPSLESVFDRLLADEGLEIKPTTRASVLKTVARRRKKERR